MNDYNLKSLSLEAKIKIVERSTIIHPQMQMILDKMDYCRDHAKYALEPVGMIVTGEKGVGKTTILNTYIKKNKLTQNDRAPVYPTLAIKVPVPATVRGLTAALLTALNDPYSTNGTVTVQTLRIYKLVEKCLVELVIFDEFQHFAERESFKLNRTVSDWTKNFMGETGKPFIFFGTPKATAVLDGKENEQLRRRIPFRVTLEAFSWKTDKKQTEFRKLLQRIEDKLPFAERANLADPHIAKLIYFATNGLMFEIMRLIRAAAVLALKRNIAKINLDLLSESFTENIAPNSPEIKNPFKI